MPGPADVQEGVLLVAAAARRRESGARVDERGPPGVNGGAHRSKARRSPLRSVGSLCCAMHITRTVFSYVTLALELCHVT